MPSRDIRYMKSTTTPALFVSTVLFLGIGCFRQDHITFAVHVPAMKTPACAKMIQEALGRMEGISAAEPSLTDHTITVVYDDRRLARKNIEFLITGLGFDANGEPGKPEAKAALPAECR